jgi:hypothetical protein
MKPASVRIRRSEDLHEGLERFWAAVAKRLAARGSRAWDVLVVFLHDTGTVLAYPALCNLPFRYPSEKHESSFGIAHFDGREDDGVLLRVEAFAAECQELDALDDGAFERAYEACIARRVDALRRSAESVAALRMLVDAPRRGAHWVNEAESLHEVVLEPLFGPALPEPRPPTSCYEVFARLLVAKGSGVYPEHSGLKWRRNDLVAVELEGDDVTDGVLDLLAEVENVAELCSGLKRLTLRATRVSKRALARAQKRLPHVAVRATG